MKELKDNGKFIYGSNDIEYNFIIQATASNGTFILYV